MTKTAYLHFFREFMAPIRTGAGPMEWSTEFPGISSRIITSDGPEIAAIIRPFSVPESNKIVDLISGNEPESHIA